ncbi:Rifampicin monooxygenase-like protein [Pleurotus pulmonarius]
MQSPSILVVGAGPVGLVLALSLAKQGVNVRIIEKEPKPNVGQRGAAIQPRTLEMHHFLGVLPDILEIASPAPLMRAYPVGTPIPSKTFDILRKNVDPSDPFPITKMMVLGSDRQSEILTSHLRKHEVTIDYGVKLSSFEQFTDHVTAKMLRLKDGAEEIEIADFAYVVGADGAHSIVRKGLGLAFVGETRAEHMVIGDIHIPRGIPNNFWHVWGEGLSTMMSLRPAQRESPDLFNFIITGVHAGLPGLTDRESMMEFISRVTGVSDIEYGKLDFISKYTPHSRMATSFRKGRAFIAGDAAHIHSPTGAQGMNSGVQDAFNLGWKLALVIKGLAKPELLDSYDAERLPVIEGMLRIALDLHTRLFKAGTDPADIWDRGGSQDQLGVNYRDTAYIFDERTEGVQVNSVRNPYGRGEVLRAGDRAPDASALLDMRDASKAMRLFDVFSVACHTVLIFAAEYDGTLPFAEALKVYPSETVQRVMILPSSGSESFEMEGLLLRDSMNHANSAYGTKSGVITVAAIRPDGVVGAIVTSVEGLHRYFEQCVGLNRK